MAHEFLQADGAVDRALVPILQTRAARVEDIITDLGGPIEVTAMQRALIDGWLKAAVAADVEFARLARGETEGTPRPPRSRNSRAFQHYQLREVRSLSSCRTPHLPSGLKV